MTNHRPLPRSRSTTLIAGALSAAFVLLPGTFAGAAIVATVPLATSGNYAVLGASTVTNTGATVLDGSLGLWPGTSIVGFPPGIVLPPGTTDTTNAAAQQAQSDLTAAYVNAAGRPIDATTTADLGNLILPGGVYAGPSKGALSLTGPLILDGQGNANSVFIFQTDSSLITAAASTVTVINGAQECNVFWQVGSSATLGASSVFTGNILALTSITVENNVTVHGRALARNAAVTLDDDTFTRPTCAQVPALGTTGGTQTETTVPATTVTTIASTAETASGSSTGTGTTAGSGGGTATGIAQPGTGIGLNSGTPGPGVPRVVGPPRTGGAPIQQGSNPWPTLLFAALIAAGTVGAASRRSHPSRPPR